MAGYEGQSAGPGEQVAGPRRRHVRDCGAGLGRAWFVKPEQTARLNRLSGLVLVGGGIWLSLARRPV